MRMTTAQAIETCAALDIAIDEVTLSAITAGAVVVYSLSGGKDSALAAHKANQLLDMLGHPKELRRAIHADLGRIEWDATIDLVQATANKLGVPLMVVRHNKHDMISRWEARFTEGKRRYANLEVFNLIGPWSSASLRFCTAEMKQQVISPALQKAFAGKVIISVVGIRREESASRANTPISKPEPRWAKDDGTTLMTWHPAVDVLTEEVFAYHERHGLVLHPAYGLGSSRLGCSFCVLQRMEDQRASNREEHNHWTYRHLVELEVSSTFSFQPTRWLADVTPRLLDADLIERVRWAKDKAEERRRLEAEINIKGLRYEKGWPIRAPTLAEAERVAEVRATILGHHSLENIYPTAGDIIGRFEQLLDMKAEKLAREAAKAERRANRSAAGVHTLIGS